MGQAAVPDDVAARLTAHLGELGFDPRTTGDESGIEVEMRACPYLDLARQHREVVCEVHRGLVEGIVGELHQVEVVPFATPEHCLARVVRGPRDGRPVSGRRPPGTSRA